MAPLALLLGSLLAAVPSAAHPGEVVPASSLRSKRRLYSWSTTVPMTRVTTTNWALKDATAADKDGMLNAAKDSLDLGELEFSPVYQCILAGKLFDQLSFKCLDSCPRGTVVVRAQCVKAQTESEDQAFNFWWKLHVVCTKPNCWHSKMRVTLHNLRLHIAGELDIPFQEVVEVGAKFSRLTTKARRLSVTKSMITWVKVSTKRLPELAGMQRLSGFMTDHAFATALLGLNITKIETRGETVYKDSDYSGKIVEKDGGDSYDKAYAAAEEKSSGSSGSGLLGFLQPNVLIGVAAGVVIILSLSVGLLWYRSRRAARRRREVADPANPEKLGFSQPEMKPTVPPAAVPQ